MSKLKLILLISVVLRVAAALYLGNTVVALPGTADQVSYHTLALRVLEGHGFSFGEAWWPVTAANEPTAHWSYLYTFYLAAVYALFGPHPLVARVIQAVAVGLLQPYLAYRLAKQLFPGDSPGNSNELTPISAKLSFHSLLAGFWGNVPLLAAAITAIYLYFIYYAATLMTEAFFLTGLLASLLLTIALGGRQPGAGQWKTALALGLALSVTVLLRQLFLLLIPFLFCWLLAAAYRRGAWRSALPPIVMATAVLLLSILPITLYNYSRFNRFVLLNTNAGYAFFWANHPIYGTQFRDASEMGDTYQRLVPTELRHLDEAALDQALLKEGVQFVRDDPGRYLRLSLSRIPAYFKFWPDPTSGLLSNVARVGSFALFLPFMLYGLLRPLAPGRATNKQPLSAALFLLYLVIFVYTAIHILSWSQVRYRIPLDAILVIFAALALSDLMIRVAKLTPRSLLPTKARGLLENE